VLLTTHIPIPEPISDHGACREHRDVLVILINVFVICSVYVCSVI